MLRVGQSARVDDGLHDGLPSAPSNIAIIGTGRRGAGGAFTLEGITWRRSRASLPMWLFVATQDDLICAQSTGRV